MIKIETIKPYTGASSLTLSTPIHGEGDRLIGLKRNLDNMDWQSYKDFKQVIIIDHSPENVIDSVKKLVANSKYPQKREILLMSGQTATGLWGKISHNVVWQQCDTPYFAFHCDDNFVSEHFYSNLINVIKDNHFSFGGGIAYRDGSENVLGGFGCGNYDLGHSVFNHKKCHNILSNLRVLPDTYNFDWMMIECLIRNDALFTCHPNIGYFWGRDFSGDWHESILKYKNYAIEPSRIRQIEVSYAGFTFTKPKREVSANDTNSNVPTITVIQGGSPACEFFRGGAIVNKMIAFGKLRNPTLYDKPNITLIVRTTPTPPSGKYIYSLDDLFWNPPHNHPDAKNMLNECEKVEKLCSKADTVITTTEYLATEIIKHTNRQPIIIPNTLPASWFIGKLARNYTNKIILNVGNYGHDHDIIASGMSSILPKICSENNVHLIGHTKLHIDAHQFYFNTPYEVNQHLGNYLGSIGLIPLVEHPFNHSKSPLKLIEFVSKGIIPVCSPVGELAKIGELFPWILVSDNNWYEAIKEAKGHINKLPELFEYIKARYNDSVTEPIWEKIFLGGNK